MSSGVSKCGGLRGTTGSRGLNDIRAFLMCSVGNSVFVGTSADTKEDHREREVWKIASWATSLLGPPCVFGAVTKLRSSERQDVRLRSAVAEISDEGSNGSEGVIFSFD